jgi:hypothetical protein
LLKISSLIALSPLTAPTELREYIFAFACPEQLFFEVQDSHLLRLEQASPLVWPLAL